MGVSEAWHREAGQPDRGRGRLAASGVTAVSRSPVGLDQHVGPQPECR